MKLKEFNPANTVAPIGARQRSTPASIHINRAGLFSLNRTASELIGVTAGDRVVLHQDEEDPESWFIERVTEKEKEAFTLRDSGKETLRLQFNRAKLVQQIFDSVAFNGDSGKILLAGQPTIVKEGKKKTVWGLLTIGLRNI